ncbi:hypothetical protein ACWDNU_46170, partial [Amycolatopsis sp. NPDC003676]
MTGGSTLAFRLAPALLLLATACATPEAPPPAPPPAATTTKPAPPDPAEIAANELGFVPVLMYHQITPNPAGARDVFTQAPQELDSALTDDG